jgi:threonine/homoserine/homoserine lactone efflux protein
MLFPFGVGGLLGFLGAIPVAGPVSALVLRYGFKKQIQRGLTFAAGAAIAESVYVLLAFFGFNFIFSSIPYFETVSKALASLILIGLGTYFVFSKSAHAIGQSSVSTEERNRKEFVIGFMVSILNPTLIASWATIITTLSTYHSFEYSMSNSISFSVGVAIGIVSWFSIMLLLIRRNHNRLKVEWIKRLLMSLGSFLILLGLFSIKRLL